MSIKFSGTALYFCFLAVLCAISSSLDYGAYFQAKKRLMKAKKKTEVLDLRKQSDTLLGSAVFCTVLTVITAVLSALSL